MNGNNIIVGQMVEEVFTPLAAVKSQEIQTGADTIEKASSTQQEWREFNPGRKEWTLTVNYLVLNDSTTNVEDVLRVGETYIIAVKDRNGAYGVTGSAIMTVCRQTHTRGSLVQGSFQFKGNGALAQIS